MGAYIPEGENVKQIYSVCGFKILLLHALCINNAKEYAISIRETHIFWRVVRSPAASKERKEGLASSPGPTPFSTANLEMKLYPRVHSQHKFWLYLFVNPHAYCAWPHP